MAKLNKDDEKGTKVGAEILAAVEKQIAESNPAQTKWTLERLLSVGIDREEAMKYIGCALSVEIFEVIKHGGQYDEARYLQILADLPELPWENDGKI